MTITTKGAIVASLGLLLMIVWGIVYGDDVKLARVDLEGFWQRQDDIATYGLNKCREEIGDIEGTYNCQNFILTLNSENWGRNPNKSSPANSNWTKDYGYCQLNSAYHSDFINSDWFKDPYKQMDYCIGVWKDAKIRKKMPWYWFYKIDERNWYVYTDKTTGKKMKVRKVHFINPPLSDKIAEPLRVIDGNKSQLSGKSGKLRLTGRKCILLARTKNDNSVIQIDTPAGRFFNWIFWVPKNSKVFECNK